MVYPLLQLLIDAMPVLLLYSSAVLDVVVCCCCCVGLVGTFVVDKIGVDISGSVEGLSVVAGILEQP